MSPDIPYYHVQDHGSWHPEPSVPGPTCAQYTPPPPSAFDLGHLSYPMNTLVSSVSCYPPTLSIPDDIARRKKRESFSLSPTERPFRERTKRHRVTPEQLTHLEQQFAIDHSPNAEKRREISEFLNMQERQTQVWFQNRRAKAKAQCRREQESISRLTHPVPPQQSTNSLIADAHNNLTHEAAGPDTIIPCTELRIGSWRRLANNSQCDLIAYVSLSGRRLTWLIHINGYSYKMELPFDTIVDARLTILNEEIGRVSLLLSSPPLFYLDDHASPDSCHWTACQDWTHGQEASHTLLHELFGPSASLGKLPLSLLAPVAAASLPPRPLPDSLEQLVSTLISKEQYRQEWPEQTDPGCCPPSVDHVFTGKRPSFSGQITTAPSPSSASSNDSSGCTTPYSATDDIHPFLFPHTSSHSSIASCPVVGDIGIGQESLGEFPDQEYYTHYGPTTKEAYLEHSIPLAGMPVCDQEISLEYHNKNTAQLPLASQLQGLSQSSLASHCLGTLGTLTEFDRCPQQSLLSPLQAAPYPYPFPDVSSRETSGI